MEKFKALLEISSVVFGVVFCFAVVALSIFNGRVKQDREEDSSVFWKRFNSNLKDKKEQWEC